MSPQEGALWPSEAPLAWFQHFSSFLLSLGFRQSHSNLSRFYLVRGTSFIFLLLYVDDIIVTGDSESLLKDFIAHTHKEFKIKNLGRLN